MRNTHQQSPETYRSLIINHPPDIASSQRLKPPTVVPHPKPAVTTVRWCFHGVKYQITLVNWLNYSQSVTKARRCQAEAELTLTKPVFMIWLLRYHTQMLHVWNIDLHVGDL